MNEEKTQTLAQIVKLVQASVSAEEFVAAFKTLTDQVAELRKGNETEWTLIHSSLQMLESKLKEDNATDLTDMKKEFTALCKEMMSGMEAEHTARMDAIEVQVNKKLGKVKDGKPGPQGQPGLQGVPGPAGSPDTAEQVRDKLEQLEGDDRLEISAIKDLEERLKKLIQKKSDVLISGRGSLWNLQDVDVAGIAIGQSIKWDGVRWIPYTPASGSNTPVLDENLSSQGIGTVFTLAHTPAANTLRVYRGGSRITIANGDYTIVGAVITLTSATQAAETLTADYEW